jgi:hypothetical protein
MEAARRTMRVAEREKGRQQRSGAVEHGGDLRVGSRMGAGATADSDSRGK